MLQVIFEIFFQIFFEIFLFLTGKIVVPLLTLGFVRVQRPSETMSKSILKKENYYLIDEFSAIMVGFLFWVVVIFVVFIL